MSLEQYKDKTRKEILLIMDIQAEEYQRLLDESRRRIAALERALQERTEYINKLADDISKDINRVWILDGFVDQVAKVDCASYSDIFLLKDTALRLKTGR